MRDDIVDRQWDWWHDALQGKVLATPREAAMSGFYRTRTGDAVAVWRDENGRLWCETTANYKPKTAEQIDQTITGDGCRVVTYDVYTQRVETGRWPDAVDPPETVKKIDDLAPHEALDAEVDSLLERYATWLASIGGKILTEDHDAKAANYAKEIAEIGSKAEATREMQKRPHLDAGKAIDKTWKPIVNKAEDAKKTVLAPTREYRIARENAELKKREAEIARQYQQQAEAVKTNAPPPPIMMPPRAKTGLRTVAIVEIFDLPALARQIATFNDPDVDFVECLKKIARKMLNAGAKVEGARLVEEKRAS